MLVGVWYCGMCKNKHTEYIDPVVTHNLKPEFVKGILSHVFSYILKIISLIYDNEKNTL